MLSELQSASAPLESQSVLGKHRHQSCPTHTFTEVRQQSADCTHVRLALVYDTNIVEQIDQMPVLPCMRAQAQRGAFPSSRQAAQKSFA